jgi:phage tail sheath gpL-like
MPITFNELPTNIRLPLAYVEFDNTRAVSGIPTMEYKVMIIGQAEAGTPGPRLAPVRVVSADHAASLWGPGSMIAAQFRAAKNGNDWLETWAIALNDNAAGVEAVGGVTLTGSATTSGTLTLYIAGRRVQCKALAAEALSALATRLAAAVNGDPFMCVAAEASGAGVNFTCKWAGETGNAIDIRVDVYGEELPAGLGMTVTPFTTGAGNPDIAPALAALGDEWWNAFAIPYTDTANRALLELEMKERFGPLKQMEGVAYMAYKGALGATQAYGNGGNNHLISCMGTGLSPTPPWEWSACDALVSTFSISNHPARPLQTLELPGVLPPAHKDRWRPEDRNPLLYDGISTYTVSRDGKVAIEKQITMYQTNAYGLPDPSYLDVTTPATLGYFRFAVRTRFTQRFPRAMLMNDSQRIDPAALEGAAVVTPSIARAEMCALAEELHEKLIIEEIEGFKKSLQVERDKDNRNRLNMLARPDIVNQFNVLAVLAQFIL